MRTLRAALASPTALGSLPRLYEFSRSACSATRNGRTPSAEIAVRFQPFCVYDSRRNACSFSPVLHSRLRHRVPFPEAAVSIDRVGTVAHVGCCDLHDYLLARGAGSDRPGGRTIAISHRSFCKRNNCPRRREVLVHTGSTDAVALKIWQGQSLELDP